MKRLVFVVLMLLTCPRLHAQSHPWTGVLAPSRAIDWSNAGVIGGIPNRTTVCSTLTSSATSAQINSAIASCSSSGGGVVLLGAGTYSNATGRIQSSSAHNVTLRGAGANETFFSPTSTWEVENAQGVYEGNASSIGNLTTWSIPGMSSQYAVGSTTITLANVANLLVGNDITLDQLDPTTDYGGILVSQLSSGGTGVSPGLAGPYTSQGMDSNTARGTCHGSSPCYSQGQTVTVVSCNGNSTIGASCAGSNVNVVISPGLEMPNWGYDYAGNSLSPSAWWPASEPQGFGIEDLSLNMTNCSGCAAVDFLYAQNSWVKGVAVINGTPSDLGLLRVENGHHIQFENDYIFGGIVGSTGVYGIELDDCFDCLVENNILQGVSTPLIHNGPGSGNVWGYNYAVNGFYTSSLLYNIPARGDHGSGIAMNLTEGNATNGHTQDTIHGTANLETDFRNNFWGTYPQCADSSSYTGAYGNCAQNMVPENDSPFHRFSNFIGNVLGTTGVETVYSGSTFASGGGPYPIYQYGGQTISTADPNVQATAMRWGNVDAVTGFSSPRFNCSEVPTSLTASTQSKLSNPCPASDTLPASFYHSSKPSWWPSGKPWPAIGPDVTSGNVSVCSGGTQNGSLVTIASQCPSGTLSVWSGGHVNSIPAMDCYLSLGGLPNGTGPPALTNFNESSCYSQTASNPPQPPTNLSATVD